MQKFCFSIRTRDGLPIPRLMIFARNLEEAECKLKQMYRFCVIVSCASDREDKVIRERNPFIEGISAFIAKRENISGSHAESLHDQK